MGLTRDERARTPLESIADMMDEAIAELRESTSYSREQKLGDQDLERRLIAKARDEYAIGSDNNIEIDEDAAFSQGEDGVWVSAWVWIQQTEDDE